MALIEQIRRLLLFIRTWVRKMHDALPDHAESKHETKQRNPDDDFPRQPIRAVVSFDDHTARTTQAEADRQYTNQKSIKSATWATFVAASLYAFLTLLMWNQMAKQTKVLTCQLETMRVSNGQAKTQWEAEHRPWMGLESLSLTAAKFTSSRPSEIAIHLEGTMVLKNFGTYPAFAAGAEMTQVFPIPTDAWTKTPLGRPPQSMFQCSDEETFVQGGEVVFPDRGFIHPFSNDMAWGWKGQSVEVSRVWLLVCVSYYDGRQKQPHHTRIWLRSTHPLNAQSIALNANSRYMPITGFESWGQEAD